MRGQIAWATGCCALIGMLSGIGARAANAQAKTAQNLVEQFNRGWQFRLARWTAQFALSRYPSWTHASSEISPSSPTSTMASRR